MAVSTTATRVSFSGDGSTVAFAFPYEYRASADLKVVLVSSANVATLKTLTTHYTISGVSDSHGGYSSATVTMVTAPASGETLVIYRSPSPVQATDVESESDPLYALNNALDLATYLVQHLHNDAVKLPIGVTESFSNVLPDLPDDDGYTYYLAPNSARTALAWTALTSGSVVISSAMTAVVTAASLAAGRTAFGLAIGTDVQAYDAQLAALAGASPSAGDIHYWTSSTAIAAIASTAAGRTALTYADPNVDAILFWDDSAAAIAGLTLPSAMSISTTNLLLDECWTIAASDETTALTTGTAKATWVFPYAVTVVSVGCSVNTAGTGLTVDINEAGTTIISTKITLDSGEKTSLTAAVPAVISDASIAAGAEMSIDIDAASGTSKGLKVWLVVRRTS